VEQVTLQAIKLKQLSRSKGNGVTEEASGDGFMNVLDSMISNLIDGDSTSVAEILTLGKTEDAETSEDASILSMLAELLQSGNSNGNLSQDVLEFLQNIEGIEGIEGIDDIEIPNVVAKLQENNFFEAMGMDEDTADTLYTLGNNTYDYLDAQGEVVKNYINSKLETKNAESTTTANTVMETGVMENRVPELRATMKDFTETNEIPIVSVSYEKSSTSEQVMQPSLGVTVPNMIQQKMIRADMSELSGESQNSNSQESENGDVSSTLSEIATANANANVVTPQFELPKVQNLSNPLFDEFNISEQITDGVKANLNLEKNEFTVKLNPESLGEVTIKLAEEGGKMVVNITAATESTAKLLNSDLTALRDSLGSLNLEIREVTVEAPENIDEAIAQFNMTSQQFSDRQRAFNNQQQDDKPYYAHQAGAYSAEEITADYTGRVRTVVDGLDTYV
jgi:hypothetical protein